MKRIFFLIVVFFIFTISERLSGQEPSSGENLIKLMNERYSGKFYKTLCFSQEVLRYDADSLISTEIMHEAYQSPGNLILKFKDWDSGEGLIFTKDSLYTILSGKVDKVQYRLHDLLIIGLDIYNIEKEITVQKLKQLSYNLSLISSDICMGKEARCVGDKASNCFWIDKSNLLFLKMQVRNKERSRSVEFTEYKIIGGAPVVTVINFYDSNNKLTMQERYFNVRPFAEVNPSIFIPENFLKSKW